jgi:hypothetical protein
MDKKIKQIASKKVKLEKNSFHLHRIMKKFVES